MSQCKFSSSGFRVPFHGSNRLNCRLNQVFQSKICRENYLKENNWGPQESSLEGYKPPWSTASKVPGSAGRISFLAKMSTWMPMTSLYSEYGIGSKRQLQRPICPQKAWLPTLRMHISFLLCSTICYSVRKWLPYFENMVLIWAKTYHSTSAAHLFRRLGHLDQGSEWSCLVRKLCNRKLCNRARM